MNSQAAIFLDQFIKDRNINFEFYTRIPEDKLDFRMVDTPKRKSDSPRESMAHCIAAQRQYLDGVQTGKLEFGTAYEDLKDVTKLSKADLLEKLKHEDEKLAEILKIEENCNKKVSVPWSSEPVSAVTMLWGLDSHEILHTGWNLALMDHLDIERFPALKEMWG